MKKLKMLTMTLLGLLFVGSSGGQNIVSNPWLSVNFSWQCIVEQDTIIDPVTQLNTYSRLVMTFQAESNRCYQAEWSEDLIRWKPITNLCRDNTSGTKQLVIPIPNCTWPGAVNGGTTNIMATGYWATYRLQTKY